MIVKDGKRTFKAFKGEALVDRVYRGSDKVYEYLPVGYTPLSYVQTDDVTPYESCLCTGIPLKDVSTIKFRCQLLSTTSSYPIVFCTYFAGSPVSTDPYITVVSGRKSGKWNISPTVAKTSRDIVDYTITSTETSTHLLKMGGWKDNYWSAITRYYYVKIYDNSNELIRYFVACRNPSDVVGMYDLVNRVFYESSGTKPFVNDENNT